MLKTSVLCAFTKKVACSSCYLHCGLCVSHHGDSFPSLPAMMRTGTGGSQHPHLCFWAAVLLRNGVEWGREGLEPTVCPPRHSTLRGPLQLFSSCSHGNTTGPASSCFLAQSILCDCQREVETHWRPCVWLCDDMV